MEKCQHCGMYGKPFLPSKIEVGGRATCEFCAEPIAIIVKDGNKLKWEKVLVNQTKHEKI